MRLWRSKVVVLWIGVMLAGVCGTTSVRARALSVPSQDPNNQTAAAPSYCDANHQIGRIKMTVTNHGVFGSGYATGDVDCFTGDPLQSCEFPKGSNTYYLFAGSFWVGAVVGRDTIVSTGADGWDGGTEMHPDVEPLGNMLYRSIINPASRNYEGAISEEDYISVYYDTCRTGCQGLRADVVDHRVNPPLYIKVTERSFAWSYTYAQDFVLFDYAIENIGTTRLKRVYMGIYVDADVHATADQNGFADDICGFRKSLRAFYSKEGCEWLDTINIAWIADNDGDIAKLPPGAPVKNVTGTRIIRTPSDSLEVAFNWWVSNGNTDYDFGPRHRTDGRDLTTGGQGTPAGDRNKYWFLRNGEFDYDQVYTARISPTDTIWKYPPENLSGDIADGYDTRYLLSFGPFDVEPGQTLPISFAYVGGEDFHSKVLNINNLPNNPDEFYRNVSFDNLGYNATWSSWLYDNPGYDTDSDLYAGKYHTCILDSVIDSVAFNPELGRLDTFVTYLQVDTVWTEGDGVPDFQGASPPPSPTVFVTPSVGKIHVRFNGMRSETTRDVFSHEMDFEGYRIYFSRDDRRSSYTLLTSYDREDYDKYVWDQGTTGWVLKDTPFTLSQLRALYSPDGEFDTTWHPLQYTRSNTYKMGPPYDSVFYFAPQDFNQSVYGVSTGIRKTYPLQLPPLSLNKDSCDASDTTADGYFKYYEYEYEITNLLPTVPYYVNVTTFDFGSPKSGLASLESALGNDARVTYALQSSDTVQALDLKVFVWPNPYRIDAGYRADGYEGRSATDRPDDRERRIHFANLPPKCTIRIYTLDGDLVREVLHDYPDSDPLSNHEEWDLITRNTQLAVSGLYYWTVEVPNGKVQIGKLVLIM
jgi:hypothetical protein